MADLPPLLGSKKTTKCRNKKRKNFKFQSLPHRTGTQRQMTFRLQSFGTVEDNFYHQVYREKYYIWKNNRVIYSNFQLFGPIPFDSAQSSGSIDLREKQSNEHFLPIDRATEFKSNERFFSFQDPTRKEKST